MLPKQFDTSQPFRIQDVGGQWIVNPLAAATKRLMPNQRYTLEIILPDGQFVGCEFTSAFDPMYSSVAVIRGDLGELISAVPDSEISFKIFQSSVTAQQLAAAAQKYILQGAISGNIGLLFAGVTRAEMMAAFPFPIPYYVQQYVRYKTEIEIAYAIYINLSAQAGMIEKTLGDLKVTRQVLIPKIQDVLVELKNNLKEWEDQVRGGGTGKSKAVVRAKAHIFGPKRTGLGGGT